MNEQSKNPCKKRNVLLWISLGLLTLYGILRLLYVTQGISLWIFGSTAENINNLLHFFGVLCLLLGGGIRLIRRHRPFRILISLLLTVLILGALCLQGLFMLFSTSGAQHTEFTSPDGAHHLVIREHSALFSTTATVYEEIAPGILKKIGNFTTDDAYHPVAAGECEILWQEDGVTISSPWIVQKEHQVFFSYAD